MWWIYSTTTSKIRRDGFTFIAGGAMGIKLSPLWYVIDSWPMIRAPPKGSGTITEEKVSWKFQ